MMKIDSITISSPDVGRSNSFVYCLYITHPKGLVYIGETRSEYGALGRLCGHVKRNGTFFKRCLEKMVDLDLSESDIHMIAFNLSEYPNYCGDANNSNRKALEYFIHGCMEEYSVSDNTIIPFDVISWTQIASRLSTDKKTEKLAIQIAENLFEKLPFAKCN